MYMISKSDRYHIAHVIYRAGINHKAPRHERLRSYRIAASLFHELGDYKDCAQWASEATADYERLLADGA